jgi:uncharacterized protein YcfJ
MTNATPRQRLIYSVVAVVFLATSSGCQTARPPASGEGEAPLSTAKAPPVQATVSEEKMRQDQKLYETVLGGVATGALVGATIGVIIEALSGGKNLGGAAVKGAVAGGILGGVDGYVTRTQQRAKEEKISELQAATKEVQKDNEALQAFLDSSNVVLGEGKVRLSSLRADLAAKRVSAEQAEQARRREEQNIDSMKATLDKAKTARDGYAKAAPKFNGTPQQKRDLDAELTRMNNQVAQLEKNIAEYNEALAVSKA